MSEHYDVVVIGGGMGGLISACQLAQAGKRVALIENLSFLGGRFTAFQVDGSEIPSGAFHMFPYGARGPFAQALKRSGVNIEIPAPTVFASFHAKGTDRIARTPFGVLGAVDRISDKFMLLRILFQSWVTPKYPGSFGEWIRKLGASEAVHRMYDRFCQFALSTTIDEIPYEEGRKVIEMIIQYGLPGVPIGGARAVAKELAAALTRAGVTVRKNSQVRKLLFNGDQVAGVVVLDRRHNTTCEILAPVVISSIGPSATRKLINESPGSESVPAIGLKLQILSPKSLIEHDSIMFCLDTQRVAGILQATNIDPGLAPPGKHLLISHQVIPAGASWQIERDLALEDWRYLFGEDFEDCTVVGVSQFPAAFPVNWAAQGLDVRDQLFADKGVWMVGDGVKPPGLIMVEGVAASAEAAVLKLLGSRQTEPWRIPPAQQTLEWLRRIKSGIKNLFSESKASRHV
jgi:phytoene dehydrogenase-like protein